MVAKLRLGLAGCGRVVERFHLPALADVDELVLVAAADPAPERRAWIAAQRPGLQLFDSTKGMLAAGELDAVLVAVPPQEQAGIAVSALARDISVLLEKPGCISVQEAHAIAGAADASSGRLHLGLNRRFMANYRALRSRLHLDQDPGSLTGEYVIRVDRGAWDPLAPDRGLGPTRAVLLDLAPHVLDALCWLQPAQLEGVRLTSAQTGPAGANLGFDVHFHGGGVVDCWIEHGSGYEERLLLNRHGGGALLYPSGHLTGWSARSGVLPFVTWLDRKLIRLGLKPDVMFASFGEQWRAFAAELRGPHQATNLAGPAELIELHRWLDQLAAQLTAAPDPS